MYGVSSCDLATTALPHRSAGNTFQAMPASGLLNGMIARAHTNRCAQRAHRAIGNRARHRLAVEPAALAFHEDAEIGGRSDFGDRVLPRLARFGLDDLAEFALLRAQQRRRAPEDLAAPRRGQPSPRISGGRRRCPRRSATSSAVPRATCARTWSSDRAALLQKRLLGLGPARGHLGVGYPVKDLAWIHERTACAIDGASSP